MQMPENIHLTSCKHKSHLLNFFLALSQKSACYSFPAHNGQRWEAVNQKTGITELLFEGQVTSWSSQLAELSCPASVALLMQANACCWGLPTALWVCMCACMSRHAPPRQVPKAVPVHVPTQSCTGVSAGRRAKSHYVCISDCEMLQQESLPRHVEPFGGWHVSACMSMLIKTYYRAVTEAYLSTLIS